MDYNRMCAKRDRLRSVWSLIPAEVLASFERSFDVEYAHNSTAIEGNTLTLLQTKAVLEDGLSVVGKTLREIYEVANHDKAFAYVKEHVAQGDPLTEDIAKDIHMLLMENILSGGIYRNVEVRISGVGFLSPVGEDMPAQVKEYVSRLAGPTGLNHIELAAWTRAEFVHIHPFVDGNGRTARMLMNCQLMLAGLPSDLRRQGGSARVLRRAGGVCGARGARSLRGHGRRPRGGAPG